MTVFAVGTVSVAWLLIRRQATRPAIAWLIAVGFGALQPTLYHLLVLTRDPVFGQWSEMVKAPSPPPLEFLLGLGLLLPIAALGGRPLLTQARGNVTLPMVWVAVTAFLVYIPFTYQRRLIHGVHLPLCLLAVGGIEVLRTRAQEWKAARSRAASVLGRGAAPALLVVMSLSNISMIAHDLRIYRVGFAPYYLRSEYIEAFRWLRDNTRPDDAVFCALETGSFIPGTAGNTVFLGHWGLTLFSNRKKDLVEAFLRSGDDTGQKAFLAKTDARYVFIGEVERNTGRFEADQKPYLDRVFENSRVSIYRVAL